MSVAYLLTGSNLYNRGEYLKDAMIAIDSMAGQVTAYSQVYESPAWGFVHPSPFLNQAIRLNTSLSPHGLLDILLEIEKRMGRLRSEHGYKARIIDIDILLYDEMVIEDEKLSIPHPRLHLRRFAMMPLLDIDNTLFHHKLNLPVSKLLEACPNTSIPVLYSQKIAGAGNEGGVHAV